MTIAAGTRLGPYEVLSPIGAGGMGEVYRARDERLGRDVAIKVLPAEVASDPERLKRFEKEARSASALNHANIVTVYDIGTTDGTSWIAMERVEGETLRKVLAAGPLPLKKLLAVATQIAEGLSKAHDTGIVHRDLKPENVMVTKEGTVKILDFGLAKLVGPAGESGELTRSPTVSAGTSAGVVVGTVGYMSPEQALGEVLDFRSDQFAFGAILYEMAAGKRAFARKSAPETMTAIIREDPEPLATAAPETPIPLRWVVDRCLAKDREERYAATKDLARDLARLREGLTEGSLSGAVIAAPAAARGRQRALALAAATLVAGTVIGVVATRRPREGPPTYRPLTFHRGSLGGARFAPDGKTILYTAAWEGKPPQIYSTRLDSTESTALQFPSANLLSISSAARLAILVLHGDGAAAIAEASLAGGAPRELVATNGAGALQFARSVADYFPGEDRLAVVRKGQIEFPVGKVLLPSSETTRVAGLRFSPDGRHIAFIESERGSGFAVGVVDLSGRKKILSTGWEIVSSLAWHPGTGELWFSGRKLNIGIGVVELHAITLSGAERLVAQSPLLLIVEDIARDGRVLARSDDWPETMMCLPPGASREVNLTWLDFSQGLALSADGQDLLFMEGGAGAGATGGVYMRKADGSTAAVRLADGASDADLSPDKKWVVQQSAADRLSLIPVGPGDTKTIQDTSFRYGKALWFPDSKRLLVSATVPGHGSRFYVRDVASGPPRPVTPEGTVGGQLSPDGTRVVAGDAKTGKWAVYPIDGGEPRPVPGVRDDEEVVGFDGKGEGIYLSSGDLKLRIDRLDLATGKRVFVREVTPSDPTGVASIASFQLTPDGKAYCYSFMRSLSRLYVVDGLR